MVSYQQGGTTAYRGKLENKRYRLSASSNVFW